MRTGRGRGRERGHTEALRSVSGQSLAGIRLSKQQQQHCSLTEASRHGVCLGDE